MKRATKLFQTIAIVAFLPLMAHAQSEDEHAFLWTQAGGMQDLGTISGAKNSIGYAISESGEAVGYNVLDNEVTASRWAAGAGMHQLPRIVATYSYASGVNSSGQIVGSYIASATTPEHAFLWTPTGGLRDLGTLGGDTSFATGINRFGEVVGYSQTSTHVNHAFSWTASGGMQDLTPSSGAKSIALAINDKGLIVGDFTSKNGVSTAILWEGGQAHSLGFGGASGINNLGQVVGVLSTGQPFLWTLEGGTQLLPTLPDTVETVTGGINNLGQLVGWSLTSAGVYHAFSWTSSGGLEDLGSLGGIYGALAYAVNDSGQVTGYSSIE